MVKYTQKENKIELIQPLRKSQSDPSNYKSKI